MKNCLRRLAVLLFASGTVFASQRDGRDWCCQLIMIVVLFVSGVICAACSRDQSCEQRKEIKESHTNTSEGALTNGLDIVAAARKQIGITVKYVSDYRQIPYPGGDVPQEEGVCSDVVVRALRTARGMDLQQLIHEDMSANLSAYPRKWTWGVKRVDANIDHRRVLNQKCYFERQGWDLPVSREARDYLPGDIVTCLVGAKRNLPHIMIVSDRKNSKGVPLIIHNIGSGVKEANLLFGYTLTGHYRIPLATPSRRKTSLCFSVPLCLCVKWPRHILMNTKWRWRDWYPRPVIEYISCERRGADCGIIIVTFNDTRKYGDDQK